jgi:hypothetical protein
MGEEALEGWLATKKVKYFTLPAVSHKERESQWRKEYGRMIFPLAPCESAGWMT